MDQSVTIYTEFFFDKLMKLQPIKYFSKKIYV